MIWAVLAAIGFVVLLCWMASDLFKQAEALDTQGREQLGITRNQRNGPAAVEAPRATAHRR